MEAAIQEMCGLRDETSNDGFQGDPLDADEFVARGATPNNLDLAAAAIELIRQKPDKGCVGGVVHRWGGQGDTQFRPEQAGEGVLASSGLDLDGKEYPIGPQGNEVRQGGHGMRFFGVAIRDLGVSYLSLYIFITAISVCVACPVRQGGGVKL